ncbi:MAG: YqeG family HAD IIIA-type phosphatase [Trueperaceae bacterium]|nr:YqeG family HAD IIIA-type phosphatase [Trueperaceae bacterium]
MTTTPDPTPSARRAPDLRLGGLVDLDADRLAGLDVAGVLLDVDETLVPAGVDVPDAAVAAWVHDARARGVRVAGVSNGAPDRVARVAAHVGIPATSLAGKPWPGAFRRAARRLGLPPHRVVMVGDQWFTDVLGAHLAGLRTVQLTPLSDGGLPHTRLLRRLERRLDRRPDRRPASAGDREGGPADGVAQRRG